jgi:hypothetical protein
LGVDWVVYLPPAVGAVGGVVGVGGVVVEEEEEEEEEEKEEAMGGRQKRGRGGARMRRSQVAAVPAGKESWSASGKEVGIACELERVRGVLGEGLGSRYHQA